jgi:proteasome lid subunit RPN8/RPN11
MNTQMIPLTVANTLDQTSKQRIEIPSGITVKQAVVQSKNAPQGEFDIFNGNGQVISGRSVDDFKDSTIYVGVKKVAGGAKKANTAFPAIVPREIIEQTTAFTAPRGALEMGGILIGHIDNNGNNVVVCGFFPEQREASSGYCEFDGSFSAIAAAACDLANQRCGGEHTPELRIIGWIHTHPGLDIFLSGIDISTFKELRNMSYERRTVAVVVDPLLGEHGVFIDENFHNKKDAKKADAKITLSEDLEARYHKFIDRMRWQQQKLGIEKIPFIMPGIFRRDRIGRGDRDDIQNAINTAVLSNTRLVKKLKSEILNGNNSNLMAQRSMTKQIEQIKKSIDSKITKLLVKIEEQDDQISMLRKECSDLKRDNWQYRKLINHRTIPKLIPLRTGLRSYNSPRHKRRQTS